MASRTHFDHIGYHHEFHNRVVHRAEAVILAYPDRLNALAEPYVTNEIFARLTPAPFAATTYAVKEDGDVIDLGDRVFEVIHIPVTLPAALPCGKRASAFSFPATRLRRPVDRGYQPRRL